MLRRLYHWTLSWARSRHAPAALGTISFIESSVFPIPADVLFIPMCAARPDRAMRFALLASVTSVLGGVFGWMIGFYAFEHIARPILAFYHKLDAFEALRSDVAGNTWLILVLLVTSGLAHLPPMKVVTILSGLVGFSLPLFIALSVITRGARFFLVAFVLETWGPVMLEMVEKRLALFTVIGIAVLVAAFAAVKLIPH